MVIQDQTIADLGEIESLKRCVSRLNSGDFTKVGSGDDAALIATTDNSFVVTTDTMIEHHDFRLDWSSAFDLGFKAVASNIADVAAMGARPTALVVAIALPGHTPVSWLESFADGLRAGCEQLSPGCAVVGGDLAAAEQVFIAVTAHGQLEGRSPVLRSGAKVGDQVAVAGTLGRAAAGLALLQSGNQDAINAYDDWVNFQLRPQPPISLGIAAAEAGATAMLDISDGLSRDAGRIAKASSVTVQFESLALSGYAAILEEAARAIEADEKIWVLHGGEDHSLLATFAPDAVLPRGFKRIGTVLEQGAAAVLLDDEPLQTQSWDSVRG